MFIGRDKEINQLAKQFALNKSSLVVCRGRRRIGKSTLVQEFAKRAERFIEFQGLAPRHGSSLKIQLNHFASQLAEQSDLPKFNLESWEQAFSLLNSIVDKRETVILLDEISWMAKGDPDFAGKLKVIWDTKLSMHSNLMVVLCGSITTWIDENILNSAGFVGRVSLTVNLKELPLSSCDMFWTRTKKNISSYEKLKVLSVIGGIPKYLEEIDPSETAEQNIKRLCFQESGFLFDEYNKIFNDIFKNRSNKYGEIVQVLVGGARRQSEIVKLLGKTQNGHLGKDLDNLCRSGFITQDNTSIVSEKNFSNRKTNICHYRLSDNYTRFYLKYILPNIPRVKQGIFQELSLENFVNWRTIIGLQFENLVLSNINKVCKEIGIPFEIINRASPYRQSKTQRRHACQIDLLIETDYTLYVCEIKLRRYVKGNIVSQVQDKISKLKIPDYLTVRPVLIYEGCLELSIEEKSFFDSIIEFGNLLQE